MDNDFVKSGYYYMLGKLIGTPVSYFADDSKLEVYKKPLAGLVHFGGLAEFWIMQMNKSRNPKRLIKSLNFEDIKTIKVKKLSLLRGWALEINGDTSEGFDMTMLASLNRSMFDADFKPLIKRIIDANPDVKFSDY